MAATSTPPSLGTLRSEDNLERGRIYRLLARCFAYPDLEIARALAGGALTEILRDLVEALGGNGVGTVKETRAWLKGYVDDPVVLLCDLSVDYTRLFVTGMPKVAAPPYESVYLGRGLLMGEPVSRVLAAYREAGLELSQDYADLPDHLVAELEFMGYLVQQETSSVEDGALAESWRERQQRFLAEHLARWAPRCLAEVASRSTTPFYRTLAEATQRFVEWDHRRLASLPAQTSTEDEEKR